ncbi:MAG: T9SS type A sorting domain-containing protein [Balneolaceae bacterium]
MSVPLRRLEQPLVIEIEQRKVRSLYKWLSKITGLEACWIEGIGEEARPLWASIKRVAKGVLLLRSKQLFAGSTLALGLLITPSVALAQTSIDISSTLTGTPHGFVLNGIDASDQSGQSLAAGDINGDGITDVIISAPSADPNGSASGETYVIFGSSSFSSSLELSSLNGTNGFVLNGENVNDNSGGSIAVGDINGDNLDDVIIGAKRAAPSNGSGGSFSDGGKIYVVYGKTTAFDSSINLSSLNGTSGFIFNGSSSNDYTGRTVVSGDINGDGFDDIITSAGAAYYSTEKVEVLFGANNLSSSINASSLNGTTGFIFNRINDYDFLGYEQGLATGDVNGDGIDDLIIGASGGDPEGDTDAGETYVIFGKTTAFSSAIDISAVIDGTNGFIINGIDANDFSGESAFAGDVNGDGIKDVIIGATSADPNGSASGETYVLFGSSSFESSIELSSLNGTTGFVLNGISANDESGQSFSVNDINHDGTKDLIVGADRVNTNTDDEGQVYVVFGSSSYASSIELSSLNGTNGFAINGTDANDYIGQTIATGDINGDGSIDIIISATHGDPNGSNSGETYVFTRPILNQSITGNEGFRMLSTPGNGTLYDELLSDFWIQGLADGDGDTDFGTGNVYVWDGESQIWSSPSNLSNRNSSAGQGFLMYVFSDDNGPGTAGDAGFPKNLTTLNFDSDVSFNSGTINAVDGVGDGDFILAGNPYLFPIDWDELTKTNLSNTVYVFDDANSVFQSWNGSVGNVANGEIGTFQGFFIEGSGGSGSLTIEPADTVSTSVSLLKRADPEPKALKVHAEAGGLKTDAWLSFQEGGEISRDDFDGLALTPLSATYLRLATVIDTEETLSINALPIDQVDEVIFPLEVSGVLNEHVATLSFEGLDKFEDWSIVIRDNETEEEYPLEEGKSIELEIDKASAKAITQPKLPTPIEVKAKTSSIRYQLIMKPGVSVHTEQPRPNLPEHILLEQNYPNPFNPNTRILFEVPRAGLVTLEVFNLLGQRVAELVNEQKAIGRYEVNFNASSLSSGVYVYKLNTGGQQLTRKMTLIK